MITLRAVYKTYTLKDVLFCATHPQSLNRFVEQCPLQRFPIETTCYLLHTQWRICRRMCVSSHLTTNKKGKETKGMRAFRHFVFNSIVERVSRWMRLMFFFVHFLSLSIDLWSSNKHGLEVRSISGFIARYRVLMIVVDRGAHCLRSSIKASPFLSYRCFTR